MGERNLGKSFRAEFGVAKMPFAESPWEIELSFGCGWQIESVGILSARSIEAYERERSGRREIPGYGKTLF